MMITLRQMEVFIAVCETQSISKAASALYVTQQGVSKSIKDLEKEVGVPLLLRTAHGMQPNEYGTYILEESYQMLSRARAMAAHVDYMHQTGRRPLDIGASFGVLAALPAELQKEFRDQNPDIELIYTDGPDTVMEKRLVDGEFDAAILIGPPDDLNIVSRPLYSERVFLFIPHGHPLYGKENVSMTDLIGQRFVMFTEDFRIARHFISVCHFSGFEPWLIQRSADFNSLRELALQHCCLFIAPEHTVNPNFTDCSYVPFPDPMLRWTMYYAVRRNKVITDTMLCLENLLNRYYPPDFADSEQLTKQ